MEKLKEHSCLSCGVSCVDPGRRIGCGICKPAASLMLSDRRRNGQIKALRVDSSGETTIKISTDRDYAEL